MRRYGVCVFVCHGVVSQDKRGKAQENDFLTFFQTLVKLAQAARLTHGIATAPKQTRGVIGGAVCVAIPRHPHAIVTVVRLALGLLIRLIQSGVGRGICKIC